MGGGGGFENAGTDFFLKQQYFRRRLDRSFCFSIQLNWFTWMQQNTDEKRDLAWGKINFSCLLLQSFQNKQQGRLIIGWLYQFFCSNIYTCFAYNSKLHDEDGNECLKYSEQRSPWFGTHCWKMNPKTQKIMRCMGGNTTLMHLLQKNKNDEQNEQS